MQRRFRITVDGKGYEVTVEEITEGTHLSIPEPGSMHVPEAAAPPPVTGSAPSAAQPGEEVSPLAGVVHSVDVKVGQAVAEGDKIASIEAMKMVTTVLAHQQGTVSEIAAKVGDAVDAGQLLMRIK